MRQNEHGAYSLASVGSDGLLATTNSPFPAAITCNHILYLVISVCNILNLKEILSMYKQKNKFHIFNEAVIGGECLKLWLWLWL